jgi:hydrogenase assembly chaperone HypC/HupF
MTDVAAEQAPGARTPSNTCITCADVAVPMRVVALSGDGLADCEDDEGRHSDVDLALLEDVKVGDEVLVHAGVAIA